MVGCAQVYKALRGGVQDVAVKFLHRTSDEDINRFVEVLLMLQPSASDPVMLAATLLRTEQGRSGVAVPQL